MGCHRALTGALAHAMPAAQLEADDDRSRQQRGKINSGRCMTLHEKCGEQQHALEQQWQLGNTQHSTEQHTALAAADADAASTTQHTTHNTQHLPRGVTTTALLTLVVVAAAHDRPGSRVAPAASLSACWPILSPPLWPRPKPAEPAGECEAASSVLQRQVAASGGGSAAQLRTEHHAGQCSRCQRYR